MRSVVVLCVCLSASVLTAQTVAEPASDPAVVEDKECTICTARHKSLQALQQSRLTPPSDTPQVVAAPVADAQDE